MEPLDLTKRPPRSPREELDGLVMLPRTIDKLRATLPGGNPGAYNIAGFSERVLETIGITETQLRDVVADAPDDRAVVAWLRENADTSKYAEISERLRARSLDDVADKGAFIERYPIIKKRPDLHLLFDVLDADDADTFKMDER